MKKDYEVKIVEYEVKKPVKKFKVGEKVSIKVDKKGIPVDKYWRKRGNDAKKDGCICLAPINSVKKPSAKKDKE